MFNLPLLPIRRFADCTLYVDLPYHQWAMPQRLSALPVTIILLGIVSPGISFLVNRTVDNKNGDEVTHVMPSYGGEWEEGDTCSSCRINSKNVNVSRAFDGTWHDATYNPGQPERVISFVFDGTAVYAFAILANHVPSTTTFTNLTFHIDGMSVGSFTHWPDSSTDILYNVSVFNQSNLPSSLHEFEIHMGGSTASLMLFDYIVYTTEEEGQGSLPSSANISTVSNSVSLLRASPMPSTSSSTEKATAQSSSGPSNRSSPAVGPLVGSLLGGITLSAIITVVLLRYLRRWRLNQQLGTSATTRECGDTSITQEDFPMCAARESLCNHLGPLSGCLWDSLCPSQRFQLGFRPCIEHPPRGAMHLPSSSGLSCLQNALIPWRSGWTCWLPPGARGSIQDRKPASRCRT